MSARDIVLGGSGSGNGGPVYVDDVFSTYLYTGNGTSQTINNDIDLVGKGGMVWVKSRSVAVDHAIYDTTRGATKDLVTNTTAAATTQATGLTAFNYNGFSIGALAKMNTNTATYASWTFRKQPKFFDIVTYTGTGVARTLAHSLGSVPGMIIVKCTSTTGSWAVYHNGLTSAAYNVKLNSTAIPVSDTTVWNSTAPTSSVFSVGTSADTNTNGATYVAYIYAHNAGGFGTTGTENAISCGSFTTNASGEAIVSLGFEPQYVMYRSASSASPGNWIISDSFRGMIARPLAASGDLILVANLNFADTLYGGRVNPTATGMTPYGSANYTYIYIAIRRPNKPPTSGTQVYKPIARTGTGAVGTSTAFGNVTDLVISKDRSSTVTWVWTDRLRGATLEISSENTSAESSKANDITGFDSMTGFRFGTGTGIGSINSNNFTYIDHLFKRAPGFFDIVCYVGTGATLTVPHNLGVMPELIIAADRSIGQTKVVGGSVISNTNYLILNSTAASSSALNIWNNTSPTASVFTVGAASALINNANDNNVAYLFATLAGISKVGSYIGNGATQTIACGFTTGARFILIKCTNTTGDWYVWDTARGITAGMDPHLSLNTILAEVITDDSIDSDTSGFIVNHVPATNINVSSATYIFLAIA